MICGFENIKTFTKINNEGILYTRLCGYTKYKHFMIHFITHLGSFFLNDMYSLTTKFYTKFEN